MYGNEGGYARTVKMASGLWVTLYQKSRKTQRRIVLKFESRYNLSIYGHHNVFDKYRRAFSSF